MSLFLVLSTSCKQENEKSQSSLYVSSVTNLSKQEPFHQILVQTEDTLFKYNYWESEKTFSKVQLTDIKDKETIVFNNNDTLSRSSNNTLFKNFNLFYDTKTILSYVETDNGQNLTESNFLNVVKNRFFETTIDKTKTPNSSLHIKEIIHLTDKKLTYYWEYYYSNELMYKETEKVNVNYFEAENQLFIIPSTQQNPYPIFQVFKADSDEIELRYFTDFEAKSKTYTKNNQLKFDTYKNYSLCRDSFQWVYYYSEQVRYKKGLDFLLQYLKEDAPSSKNDGFINIHFTINCNGEVGRFGLELLDRNYQPTHFEPALVKHIVDKVSQLDEWSNLHANTHRTSKDIKMFFLIRIANQKITDICP